MISQQQNNIHEHEEETLPPLEQKHPSAPTSSWRSWSRWLRILGVGLALVCGIAIGAILGSPIYMLHILSYAWALLIFFFVGIVSACLLRTWWSLLIVPLALTFALVAFTILFVLSYSLWYGGFDLQEFVVSLLRLDTVVLFVVPIISAAIGTPIGKQIEKRLRH